MTRQYVRLISVAILISVFTTPITAQPETVAELRAKADQGGAEAQFNLGVRHANDEGVPQDDVEAYKWLNLATTYADASKQEEYAEVRDGAAERLTPQQRAEGQKLSREWFAAHPREP